MGVQLRPYRASDLDTLFEIDQRCFAPGISYSRAELEGFIAHRRSATWVAEADSDTVGFLVARREPGGAGHIITIDVVESWRRRGVGKALMDAAESWAAGLDLAVLYLETAVDNEIAQRFYRRRGYHKLRRVENYYADGAAGWIMVKQLKEEPGS